MKSLKSLLILLFAGTLLNSCKKEDNGPQLPPLTHEGKNVIAWKMDGKVYISEGSEYFFGNNSAYFLKYDTSLIVQGSDRVSNTNIQLGCIFKSKNLPLYMQRKYPYRGIIYDYSDPAGGTIPTGGNQYQTDDTHTGTVIVTYYDSSIIAGTFQMDVVNDAGVVRHITEGRFDIKSE